MIVLIILIAVWNHSDTVQHTVKYKNTVTMQNKETQTYFYQQEAVKQGPYHFLAKPV